MGKIEKPNTVWLAADFHMASTYSCRIPVSSQHSALAMPAPGPATVRLAMIRTAIELFGVEATRQTLFPMIRSAPVLIRPPDRVAISTQLLQAYKVSKSSSHLKTSLAYREMCHAQGAVTIYLAVPINYEDAFREILQAIGYWGQANSLTFCTGVYSEAPNLSECARPLRLIEGAPPLGQFFACIVSEFRSEPVGWDEIMQDTAAHKLKPLELELYVWPMLIIEQRRQHKLLRRCSLIP